MWTRCTEWIAATSFTTTHVTHASTLHASTLHAPSATPTCSAAPSPPATCVLDDVESNRPNEWAIMCVWLKQFECMRRSFKPPLQATSGFNGVPSSFFRGIKRTAKGCDLHLRMSVQEYFPRPTDESSIHVWHRQCSGKQAPASAGSSGRLCSCHERASNF